MPQSTYFKKAAEKHYNFCDYALKNIDAIKDDNKRVQI